MGMGHDYGSASKINPLQVMLTFDAANILFADVPAPGRLAIKYIVCPIARAFGFKPFYPEYY